MLFRHLIIIAGIFGGIAYSGKASSSANSTCPCEEIRRTKICENPDCIKICNLQNLFHEINRTMANKCLKDNKQYDFNYESILLSGLEPLIKNIKIRIQEIEKENNKKLQDTCPNCHLNRVIKTDFPPHQKSKNCPEKYLKTYTYTKSLRSKNPGKCGNTERTKLHDQFDQFTNNIVRSEDSSPEAQKLWKACPDPCSFYISSVTQMDTEKCAGKIKLNVHCTHEVKRNFLDIPFYDVKINYKGVPQCLK